MIRIRKSKLPSVLKTQGPAAIAKLKALVRSGKSPLPFDKSLYAHNEVKVALRRAQHDKCAFCESKIMHIGFGDVEHYRPKAAVRQGEEDELQYPGYYWLAYDWTNLFLSCQLCNQRFKRNCFPLRHPNLRALSPQQILSKESPLLINPSADYPEKHLVFEAESAIPKNGSMKGKVTIEVMGLNRAKLLERRLKRHNQLLHLLEIYAMLTQVVAADPSKKIQNLIQRTQIHIEEARRDDAEYAAMARATLS